MTIEWAPTAAIVVAVITVFGAPFATRWAQRKVRNPDAGWEAAIEALKADLTKTKADLEHVSTELDKTKADLAVVTAALHAETQTRAGHERTIQHQSRLILALGARGAQLEAAWPANLPRPVPDPAWAQDLVLARIVDPGTSSTGGNP